MRSDHPLHHMLHPFHWIALRAPTHQVRPSLVIRAPSIPFPHFQSLTSIPQFHSLNSIPSIHHREMERALRTTTLVTAKKYPARASDGNPTSMPRALSGRRPLVYNRVALPRSFQAHRKASALSTRRPPRWRLISRALASQPILAPFLARRTLRADARSEHDDGARCAPTTTGSSRCSPRRAPRSAPPRPSRWRTIRTGGRSRWDRLSDGVSYRI